MAMTKDRDIRAMANRLLNTRPDASAAEVLRKAAGMLVDLANERAHLTQPAQAVDVGALRELNEWLLAQEGMHVDPDHVAEAITRALAGEKAERVWRCTRSYPTGDGGTCHSLEYARSEADMLILQDKGYACMPLPALPTDGEE